ncbi:MAG TPA: NAD-dependent epimerase/dehydratase family protein [Hyphomicrobiaceae bacterium]|nr:NAD-dependent epimerase/dehydratase family protein [Hyphomicrobiaceae bacterium]
MRARLVEQSPILVTGARGLLGTALRKALAQLEIPDILTPSRAELDLLHANATQRYFAQYRPATVVHLAAVVFGLGGNLGNQTAILAQNTLINNNIFTAIARHPVRQCFYAGTVASYPFPYKSEILQESEFFNGLPHAGEFGYASAKRHAYCYLHLLGKDIGLRFAYGIFTNLYGENDRFNIEDGHVIPSLIAKAHAAAQSNGRLEVWGDGSAERDFLHADDAAQAVLACLASDETELLVNISSGVGVSMRTLAEHVAAAAGLPGVVYLPAKPTGIPRRVVDNTRMRRLGVEPAVPLEDGIRAAYRWFSQNAASART